MQSVLSYTERVNQVWADSALLRHRSAFIQLWPAFIVVITGKGCHFPFYKTLLSYWFQGVIQWPLHE